MNIIQIQLFIIIITALLFYLQLCLSGGFDFFEKENSGSTLLKLGEKAFKNLIKSINVKTNIDLISLIKIYLFSTMINIFIFELYKLGKEELIVNQYTFFIIFSFLFVVIKIERLDDITIFKKSIQLISDALYILLLATQYFLWIKIVPNTYVNIIFFVLFLIHFIFSYVAQSSLSLGNIFDKIIDFQIKLLWLILTALIFLSNYKFSTFERNLEFFFVSIVFLKFFNAIELSSGKLKFRQSIDLYRRYFTVTIIVLSLGSIFVSIYA